MTDTPDPRFTQFREQTPQTYKWAMGAGGLVVAVSAAISAIKPEVAGYSIGGTLLFILLIFIVLSLEAGTQDNLSSSPLANNARNQVYVLSWFSTLAFIFGATALISSILFRWPLDLALVEDRTTEKYLLSIKSFKSEYRAIERIGSRQWQERSLEDNSVTFSFFEERFDSSFLYLQDEVRKVWIRVPTRGGMMQWSVTENRAECKKEYCWGDIGEVNVRR